MALRRFVGFCSSLLMFASLCFVSGEAEARPFRVNYIPNGVNVPNGGNACLTCHQGFGGGPRTSFGLDVEALVTPGSTAQFWSAELAAKDSDGDDFSNGEELQDPTGAWLFGQANPGTSALVTHPGNANSKPEQAATPTPTVVPAEPTATPTQMPQPTSPGDALVAYLSGSNEVPAVTTNAYGVALLHLHEPEGVLEYWLQVFDIQNVSMSHIHTGAVGVNGGVRFPLTAPTSGSSSGTITGLTAADIAALRGGELYVNVHTTQNGSGEIRGQAEDKHPKFKAVLTGDQEVPPVTSPASGLAKFTLSEDLTKLSYTLDLSSITGVTMAHIHLGAEGVNGGVIFPIANEAFTSISGEITLSDAQVATLLTEGYYVNVHTTQNGNGEIRGQVVFDVDSLTDVVEWLSY